MTRTLKFVYAGSAFVQVRQHVDNRPGHGGDAYDDTYTKQVKWSITWPVTIEPERVLVGTPTASVSGTSSADLHSAGHSSCDSPVMLPVLNGKSYVPTSFVVVGRTPQFLTIRLERFPEFWAASPSCLDGQNAPAQVPQPDGAVGQAWVKSWSEPEFKVALFNNYKITPASIGNRYGYPLPAGNIWKKVTFDWSARLTLDGFSKGTTPAQPKPPAKKPCVPKTSITPLDEETANIYLEELARDLKKPVHFKYRGLDLTGEFLPLYVDESTLDEPAVQLGFDVLVLCSDLTIGHELYFGDLRDKELHDEVAKSGLYVKPPPEGANVDITSSPDALSVQIQGGSGTPKKTKVRIKVTSAAVQTLRAGKPLTLTLKGTFATPGKASVTATTKITLQGPPPKAGIASVTFNGTAQNPSIVVHGVNLGSKPAPNPPGSPSHQPLCPVTINGNVGLDYGTSLYLDDTNGNWAAGRYRPSSNELDCIALIVTKFTPTEVDYRLGSAYQQFAPKYQLSSGDTVQVAVNGATKTVHVKYGATVTS